MKMHRIILTLLAVMLVATIGTTATVAYAKGPGGDDLVDTPDTLLAPANAEQFAKLPADVRDQLENDFLPLLSSQAFTKDERAAYFTEVVNLEYRVRVEEKGGDPGVSASNGGNLPGGDCTLAGPHFYAGSLTVSSYSSVSCDYTQASITISGELLHRASDTYETNTRVRHRVTSNFIAVFLPRQSGLWNTCGEFATTPQTGRDLADTFHDKVCLIEIPVN